MGNQFISRYENERANSRVWYPHRKIPSAVLGADLEDLFACVVLLRPANSRVFEKWPPRTTDSLTNGPVDDENHIGFSFSHSWLEGSLCHLLVWA